jgi:hypothetical protein
MHTLCTFVLELQAKPSHAEANVLCKVFGTVRIQSRIAMEKAAFNKKKALFTSKMDLELRKKLVKCYIWSIALYGAETWALRAVD